MFTNHLWHGSRANFFQMGIHAQRSTLTLAAMDQEGRTRPLSKLRTSNEVRRTPLLVALKEIKETHNSSKNRSTLGRRLLIRHLLLVNSKARPAAMTSKSLWGDAFCLSQHTVFRTFVSTVFWKSTSVFFDVLLLQSLISMYGLPLIAGEGFINC